MRIISGLFKGKKILQPADKITRPLKDLTKESVFNVIEHSNKFSVNIKDSIILDLYSGVGSFGLECLSREAKHVTFVENYKGVLTILKKNLFSLKNINNYKILNQDINLKSEIILSKLRQKNDIVFLDPPFKDKNLDKILSNINNNKILKKDGIVIIHRHKKENDNYPENFKILEKKIYGISKIIFGLF